MSNPGVQDCGAPAAYSLTGRGNSRLLRPPDASPDDIVALRTQPPCSELVNDRLRQATWSIGGFIVLAAAGAILGLVDDRLRFHRAPRFEKLLRERPTDAPGAVWDQPVVPQEDIGQTLPDVESSDVEAFVVWSVVTLCLLLLVSGIGATFDTLGGGPVVAVVAAVLLAIAARATAGADLVVLEAGLLERRGRFDRALQVMIACDWAGRLRPAFGTAGVQSHAMVRRGVARDRALVDIGVAWTVAALVHVALLGLLFLLMLVAGPDGGSWPPYPFLLVLSVLTMTVAGLVVLPARLHRLPCTLGRQTLDRLRERWTHVPNQIVAMTLLAVALTLLHGLVVLAGVIAFGGGGSIVSVLFVAVLGLAFGALAPVPEGFVAADAVIVLGLSLVGVDIAAAVAAVLLWRLVMTWLPLLPGYFVNRVLLARGTL